MVDVLTVDAMSTIALLMAIANMYPSKRLIHVFLDNARYTTPFSFKNGWQAGMQDQASFYSGLLPAP